MNRRDLLGIGTGEISRIAGGLAIGFLLVSALLSPADAQQSVAEVFVAQAILSYDEKRYDEALSLLREALQIEPDNVEALYYTGLVYLAQRKPDLAAENLEKARIKAPKEISILFQLGVAYFTLEQYDRAQPLLTQVFNEQPRMDSVGYYVGFMRYRNKNYQGALRAFTTGTSSDPDIQQLTRFYAGLTLAILGLPERAAAEVEEALRLQPSSPVTGPAERLRDTILAARERERRFRAEVRVGGFYDDNVAVNPKKSNDPTAEALRGRKTKSPGEIGALRLEYSWLRTGPWEATVTYSLFQTINNELPAFNVQNHLGALGGFYRGAISAMPFQLGAQYVFDYLTLGGDDYLKRHSATLFGTLVENAGNLTTVQGRFQIKNFSEAATIPEEERDAKNWMAGLLHVFRFEADKHYLRFRYQFDVEDADGKNFRYLGHRALAGAQYTLPSWETRLKYDFDLHLRDYRHEHSLLPADAPSTKKRKDAEQTHVVRVEQPLPFNLTLAAEYQAILAHSNLAVYNFKRNVSSLSLSWQY